MMYDAAARIRSINSRAALATVLNMLVWVIVITALAWNRN